MSTLGRISRPTSNTRGLPPKLLEPDHFVEPMLSHPEQCAAYREVELTIDMNGYGTVAGKLKHCQLFTLAPYAERAGIKLFYDWDQPLLLPERIQALDRPPDLVIYQ